MESEKVSYNAGYTNVHELIPWRTLTGPPAVLPGPPVDARLWRGLQQLPPAGAPEDAARIHNKKPNGNKEIALNFITPHQKWGIHSTYSDNLMMLTLNRGGRWCG
jgi:nitrate reductase alpha subunit